MVSEMHLLLTEERKKDKHNINNKTMNIYKRTYFNIS